MKPSQADEPAGRDRLVVEGDRDEDDREQRRRRLEDRRQVRVDVALTPRDQAERQDDVDEGHDHEVAVGRALPGQARPTAGGRPPGRSTPKTSRHAIRVNGASVSMPILMNR